MKFAAVCEFEIYGRKMPIGVSLQHYSSLVIITFPIVVDNTNCLLCLMSYKPVRGCSVVNFFFLKFLLLFQNEFAIFRLVPMVYSKTRAKFSKFMEFFKTFGRHGPDELAQ